MTDIKKTPVGYVQASGDDAEMRVPAALWTKYGAAKAKLAAVLSEMETAAVRPIAVTPDQYDAIKAAVKPGTWIVVREVEVRVIAAPTPAEVAPGSAPESPPAAPPAPDPPPGPPKRPRMSRCTDPARGGLPHVVRQYVYTAAPSEYDIGSLRVDGICQCGERVIDVQCPHRSHEMNQQGQGQCKDCHRVLTSQAGAIDNRNLAWRGTSPQGAADPNVPLPIPPGTEENVRIDVYRAPGA